MIQVGTRINTADNSGAKKVQCIRVLKGTRHRYARLGDRIVVSIKEADPRAGVKKKEVHNAVVARQKKEYRRKDGSYIRFDDNAVIIVNKENNDPKATRIFGPIPRELRDMGYSKIASLAPEVL
ncbi:50S ribosomal protein L14 [bacterium]|nr:50S ribosomal protein L14 [bacterium]|tara:strand:- start:897 stop:1268 length:372 start_codon:yes stop_codon:yes gene_type:complete